MAVGKKRLFPGILAAAFAGTLALSVVLTAVLLDSFLIRFDRGSVTTMLPGFVYGSALILKIGLIETAILGVVAFVTMATARSSTAENGVPVWGTLSVMSFALAPLIGTLVVLVTQSVLATNDGETVSYFARMSRTGVFALMAILLLSIASAIVSLVRRERPVGFSIIGLLAGTFALAVFQYLEFYKFGFDQDRWNNI